MANYFTSVYGQKSAKDFLTRQLKSSGVSHAYIFVGPSGVGREYFSSLFAWEILNPESRNITDETKITEIRRNPDFIYLDGKDGIKIEEIRELIERINLSPNRGNKKVALISKAENMGTEAANALLKTFEEPPEDTTIILTLASEKSIPETILSRGQKIKLFALDNSELRKLLARKYDPERVEEVSVFALGNIGEAIRMLESEEYFSERREFLEDAFSFAVGESVLEKFSLLEKYDKHKMIKEFVDTIYQLIHESISPKPRIGDLHQAGLAKIPPEKRANFDLNILKIYQKLSYNINLRMAMEGLVLESYLND